MKCKLLKGAVGLIALVVHFLPTQTKQRHIRPLKNAAQPIMELKAAQIALQGPMVVGLRSSTVCTMLVVPHCS